MYTGPTPDACEGLPRTTSLIDDLTRIISKESDLLRGSLGLSQSYSDCGVRSRWHFVIKSPIPPFDTLVIGMTHNL